MPPPAKLRVVVEGRAEEYFLKAILRKELESSNGEKRLVIEVGSPLARGSYYLLTDPGRPFALVMNSDSTDPEQIAESRGASLRVLGRIYPLGWHIAWAIPRIDAWAMADPRIRAAFEADPATRTDAGYYARAHRIVELTKEKPFDVEQLCRVEPEFRQLYEFIQTHTRQPAGSAG